MSQRLKKVVAFNERGEHSAIIQNPQKSLFIRLLPKKVARKDNTIWASEYASRKIYEKMQNGELITNPLTDKRKYENLELELLTENDRVYSDGEFKNFDEKVKALKMSKYIDYIVDNNWETPTEKNLNKRVQSGELIYVDDYTRTDGTKVHGYYRRRPYFASKKSSK